MSNATNNGEKVMTTEEYIRSGIGFTARHSVDRPIRCASNVKLENLSKEKRADMAKMMGELGLNAEMSFMKKKLRHLSK